ncbi:methyltransferase family protein [Hydrogenispora ethanolica]|uniref:Methyltransferase family protein n=1 Tax=Hydrogenispora ethanolica TaxID=1082276 RepID=A0A4R1RC33_HYDET|nr:methyltransferase domain-containing protein [Hydrogenispora ethanolica]TCL63358.1 methyltransferase family protein [Hydrogenispora ethanolica]
MESLGILSEIKEIYSKNRNIIQYLKNAEKRDTNSIEDIMISYDFQSGTYIEEYLQNPSFHQKYCSCLSKVMEDLNVEPLETLMEIGVGEATVLGPLLNLLKKAPRHCYGFDISWSRIKYAKRFLEALKVTNVELFVGDLFHTPLKDSSVDIVYTSHSLEPNGGREKEALAELYRITKKYLILLEPLYELADEKAQKRMIEQGYVTKLYSAAVELGYPIMEHRLFGASRCRNPLNPTGLIVIRKDSNDKVTNPFGCPITKTDLTKINDVYYSQESMLAYPIVGGIPCLLPRNAVVATKFLVN